MLIKRFLELRCNLRQLLAAASFFLFQFFSLFLKSIFLQIFNISHYLFYLSTVHFIISIDLKYKTVIFVSIYFKYSRILSSVVSMPASLKSIIAFLILTTSQESPLGLISLIYNLQPFAYS